MAATPGSVDEYLAEQPAAALPVLREVRAVFLSALPQALEVISYGMPAYRVPAGVAVFFAGWKQHWSLYPASTAVVEQLGDQLQVFRRGTIRFNYAEPVRVELLRRFAEIRIAELQS